MLCIGHVLHHLGKEGGQVIVVQQTGTIEVQLFQPAQFFTVRTVGKHRLHVAAHGLAYNAVCTVEHVVGATESGYITSRVIHKA
ncbi:hypothetical protein SDC9_207614 [bioreactor metagenome]|uniref:Uncharacterized protein n=1 Tax=bioreactor metagenome TaxID=1076179 RepID=A0A645J9W3_9ZZZZ